MYKLIKEGPNKPKKSESNESLHLASKTLLILEK